MTAQDLDGYLAVLAHQLLGSLSICSGAVRAVLDDPDRPPEQQEQLLQMAFAQAERTAETLKALVWGQGCPVSPLGETANA